MPAHRLYFDDAYLTTFTARVTGRRTVEGRPALTLDRTAFYPEGGGQPSDRGTLAGVEVRDVRSQGDEVWHLLDAELGAEEVEGRVDWARRFDHMQQHHGQHLLSAAFEELFRMPTLAFHLGADYASIDLPGDVTDAQARAAEARTNEVIWEDRPVDARFVTPDELARLPLRKPPTVDGPVRVVSVEGFDHSACGGTHPHRTGAVGLLHVRRRERRGDETRIEFLCGGRALADHQRLTGLVSGLAAGLSVGADELPEAITRLREQESVTRKRLAEVTARLLGHEAAALARAAIVEAGGQPAVVAVVRDDLDLSEARMLVNRLVGEGVMAAVGVRGPKSQLVVARPEDAAADCVRVVNEVLAGLGGRGGGQARMAQGGVPDPSRLADAVAEAARLLRDAAR